MTLPAQVRRQSEAVEALYKQLEGTPEAPELAAEEVGPTSEDVPLSIAPKSDQSAEPPEQVVVPDNQDGTLIQKYRTLQGMYNAEVPRLHASNRDLVNRVAQLEQLLSSAGNPKQNNSVAMPAPAAKHVTDADVAEYGETLDVMRRAAQDVTEGYRARIDDLESTIKQFTANTGPKIELMARSQAEMAEHKFWDDLSAFAPQWRETNNNPEFHAWLLAIDPLTNITRQTYLDDAQSQKDARRVAAFFEEWEAGNGSGHSTAPEPKPQSKPNRELESQIAPGRGRSVTNSGSQPKMYTKADIAAFYRDVHVGMYAGKAKEKGIIEADIFAAQRDGRIRS